MPLMVKIIEDRILTTKHIAVRERGREVGPGDPSCVWRLGVTLRHDPSPQNPVAWC